MTGHHIVLAFYYVCEVKALWMSYLYSCHCYLLISLHFFQFFFFFPMHLLAYLASSLHGNSLLHVFILLAFSLKDAQSASYVFFGTLLCTKHQSWDRENEKQLLSPGDQTVNLLLAGFLTVNNARLFC